MPLSASTITIAEVAVAPPITTDYLDLLEPASRAVGVMMVLAGMLVTWETLVHQLRERTPTSLLPVIESILGEIGGLGFIGLLLEVWRPDDHELLETFEFFHSAFFQVAIAYFLFSGLLVSFVIFQLEQLRTLALDSSSGSTIDTSSSEEKDATTAATGNDNIFWSELTLDTQQRAKNFALKRNLMLEQYGLLDESFRLDMEPIFAAYLQKLVHLNPIQAWVPLMPILAAGQAVDLLHGVIDRSSENAVQVAGYFASTPAVVILTIFWQVAVLSLSIFNFVQTTRFKVQDIQRQKQLQQQLQQSQEGADDVIVTVEDSAQIPDWYLSSIKYHAWFTISGIVFFVLEVLSRDVQFMMLFSPPPVHDNNQQIVGNTPNAVEFELAIFSFFVLSSLLQLRLTPSAFWNFCLVNIGRDKVSKPLVEEQIMQERIGSRRESPEDEGGGGGEYDRVLQQTPVEM